MLNEVKSLLASFKTWTFVFVPLVAVFFALPSPLNSFSSMAIERLKADLMPAGVQLIVTDPLSAFSAQVLVALFLGFLVSLPVFLWKLAVYLSPALYGHEKRAIARAVLPSSFLFAAGAAFAYFVLAPEAMRFLYLYAGAVNAASFITVKELVAFTLGMVVFTGVLFLLPVFMIMLTRFGLVRPVFWRQNARWAIAGAVILSAVITPDGSGVTMTLLAAPLAGLYFVGLTIANSKFEALNSKQYLNSKHEILNVSKI